MENIDFKAIRETKAPPQERMLIEIPKSDIGCHYSSLTEYLDKVVDYNPEKLKAIDELIIAFHLGAVREQVYGYQGTVLPRINNKGKVTGGSVLFTDPQTGEKLRKDPLIDHLAHWYSYDYYVDNDVFFGEHLLANKPIAVVVEEKTALLGSLAEPTVDWLAVGDDYHLTEAMMDRLAGRRVILFPDDVCHDYWKEQFGSRFKVDAGFVSQDINAYLIDRIRRGNSP